MKGWFSNKMLANYAKASRQFLSNILFCNHPPFHCTDPPSLRWEAGLDRPFVNPLWLCCVR